MSGIIFYRVGFQRGARFIVTFGSDLFPHSVLFFQTGVSPRFLNTIFLACVSCAVCPIILSNRHMTVSVIVIIDTGLGGLTNFPVFPTCQS